MHEARISAGLENASAWPARLAAEARGCGQRVTATTRRWKLMLSVVLCGLLVGVAGNAVIGRALKARRDQAASQLRTAVAWIGDLTISASGAGTLTAAEVELDFLGSGEPTVTGVYVQPGDLVHAGDLLAEVESAAAKQEYVQAKRGYDELTSLSGQAAAMRAQAAAQAQLQRARLHLEYLISPEVMYWEGRLEEAQADLQAAQVGSDGAPAIQDANEALEIAQTMLAEAWEAYEEEYVPQTFPFVDGYGEEDIYIVPTGREIEEARYAIDEAAAELDECEEWYAVLMGATAPVDTSNPHLVELIQAQLHLEEAEATLAGTRIIAPSAGTITAVNISGGSILNSPSTDSETESADVGDGLDMPIGFPSEAGKSESSTASIVLADTNRPYLEIYWDESDWTGLTVGQEVQIIFEQLPEAVYLGFIAGLDRELYTSGGSSAVRSIVSLATPAEDLDLPIGANVTVEAITGQARNAVLIPVEALHETAAGGYIVYVVNREDGTLTSRDVEVGLMDALYAEVLSGLQAGEVVATGELESR